MSNSITELTILGRNNNIFSHPNIQYIIPLYQRAFAWEDAEISQLIEDIRDFKEDNYYIGSLIVYKRGDQYEVIDGQQRLTALFLLLNSLEVDDVENILTFACRKKSDDTLKNINNLDALKSEDIEVSLQKGKQIIEEVITGRDFNRDKFLAQLEKVKLYRIEVPQNTDLNRYFEIMNTRGEQLEQHDILKATLMSFIENNENRALFAKIWEACSDMTGYVQMHFDTDMRRDLFDYDWNFFPRISFTKKKGNNKKSTVGFDIRSIVKPTFRVNDADGITDRDERIRFESIISFPFFLLHTLKVFVADKDIQHINEGETLVYELLDDKKLTDAFDKVISNGQIDGELISNARETFSLDFIKCLLKCRFLFDKYIIKREFVNENSDGEWSLKQLEVSGQASNKKAYYINTDFGQSGEWKTTRQPRTEINLMLQSCLRVSYTSPKIMHWITELIKWLYIGNAKNLQRLNEFEWQIEGIAANAVKEGYLDEIQDQCYDWGTDTPHIVFNYLDYLLWKKNRKKYGDFVFEFRNSVEHWYPRHPSEGTFEQWEDGVDSFGNLCIIQRSINSKFSNLSPEAKKSTFHEMIAKGSLKLREMAELTGKLSDKNSSQHWKDEVCRVHEEDMLEMLMKACGSE